MIVSSCPQGSKRRVVWERCSGTKSWVRTIAAIPIGTLTQKIARQPMPSTRRPPTTGPRARLMPTVAPQTPSARPRSRGSVKVLLMIESATGFSIEPPIACRQRKAISSPVPPARLQSSEPRVKKKRPIWKTRRRPKRSAVAPEASSRLPSTSE